MNSDRLHRATIILLPHELEYVRTLIQTKLRLPGREGPVQLDEVARWEPVKGGYLLRLRDEE